MLPALALAENFASLSLTLFITGSSVQDLGGPVPKQHGPAEYRDILGELDMKMAAKESEDERKRACRGDGGGCRSHIVRAGGHEYPSQGHRGDNQHDWPFQWKVHDKLHAYS